VDLEDRGERYFVSTRKRPKGREGVKNRKVKRGRGGEL